MEPASHTCRRKQFVFHVEVEIDAFFGLKKGDDAVNFYIYRGGTRYLGNGRPQSASVNDGTMDHQRLQYKQASASENIASASAVHINAAR
jgi:hypothetical protein